MADDKKTIIVFSGDLDRAMAAMIIARGAAAMGNEVTLFFTFWGLNLLRRPEPVKVKKDLLAAMFGWMMPRGAGKVSLSKMHMGGMGTAMMQHVMKTKNVPTLPEMIAEAQEFGVKFIACTMSMDVMGIKEEELIDGVEFGGVAAYLGSADEANVNLFI
ncbi:MAG: DsrE/DsrF/DrsH-like family protein [Armatimonadota bacterium]